ncbi:hypothetical protein GEV33_010890 [Tenebrio molitor]|uniref:Uncharacterized protein n=1 Tax=Tenebrio molitor TaxID=7067 RepID=A0A8J6HCJ4_TENMO|nr:hypothetical protein GEV33_010890 [Tenebrio molitor]
MEQARELGTFAALAALESCHKSRKRRCAETHWRFLGRTCHQTYGVLLPLPVRPELQVHRPKRPQTNELSPADKNLTFRHLHRHTCTERRESPKASNHPPPPKLAFNQIRGNPTLKPRVHRRRRRSHLPPTVKASRGRAFERQLTEKLIIIIMMMMTMWQKLDSKALVNLRLCPIAVVEAVLGGGAGEMRKGGHGRVLKIHLNNKARPYANQGGGGYARPPNSDGLISGSAKFGQWKGGEARRASPGRVRWPERDARGVINREGARRRQRDGLINEARAVRSRWKLAGFKRNLASGGWEDIMQTAIKTVPAAPTAWRLTAHSEDCGKCTQPAAAMHRARGRRGRRTAAINGAEKESGGLAVFSQVRLHKRYNGTSQVLHKVENSCLWELIAIYFKLQVEREEDAMSQWLQKHNFFSHPCIWRIFVVVLKNLKGDVSRLLKPETRSPPICESDKLYCPTSPLNGKICSWIVLSVVTFGIEASRFSFQPHCLGLQKPTNTRTSASQSLIPG